jgi:hypothetical protein
MLQWDNNRAPGGGAAFVAGSGDATTGSIGVVANGTWANSNSSLTITRPAYADLTVESIVVQMHL